MKFTLNTKPLADALNLGVINANISKFYQKSCLAQLTATQRELKINLEASYILTEIILKGSGDIDAEASVFVDCALLKSLVNTIEGNTITIEFVEGGIVLHSGSSKFTLSQIADSSEMRLKSPELAAEGAAKIKIEQSDWNFIKDHQMYALATSFVQPIYTNVWVGESGDVIAGDANNSLFTFSKKNKLGRTCVLSDTVINLLTSLPEGAEITQLEKGYRIDARTETFDYAAEFTPQYESDPNVGSYSAETIMSIINKDDNNCIKVSIPALSKFMSQAELLARSTDNSIMMRYESASSELILKDDNVDCKVKVEGTCKDFEVEFRNDLLKSVLSNVDEVSAKISPVYQTNENDETIISGVVIWTAALVVALGGVE